MRAEGQNPAARRAAFDAVVTAYEAPLLRYAVRLTANSAAAEDIVQNTFVKLIRSWRDDLVPSAAMSAWLYRVVHNEAVDHVRREVRRQRLHARHAADTGESVAPDMGAESREPDRALAAAAALQKLPDRERQLVILKVYERKSYREIATIAGLSVGNVGFILHHAMRRLARILSAPAEGTDDGPSIRPPHA